MRYFIKFATLFIILSCFISPTYAQTEVDPSSGPPGTEFLVSRPPDSISCTYEGTFRGGPVLSFTAIDAPDGTITNGSCTVDVGPEAGLNFGFSFEIFIDSDGDGIRDRDDDCSGVSGTPPDGCPDIPTPEPPQEDSTPGPPPPTSTPEPELPFDGDLDGDGVKNGEDECPEDRGTIDTDGCPAGVTPANTQGPAETVIPENTTPPPLIGSLNAPPAPWRVIIIELGVNVRSGPGINFSIIGQVPQNYYVSFLREENGWTEISAGGISGWIRSDFLSDDVDDVSSGESPDSVDDAEEELEFNPLEVAPIPSLVATVEENCADLIDYLNSRSSRELSQIESAGDTCEYLRNRNNEDQIVDLARQYLTNLSECPVTLSSFLVYLDNRLNINDESAERAAVEVRMSPTPCETARSLAENNAYGTAGTNPSATSTPLPDIPVTDERVTECLPNISENQKSIVIDNDSRLPVTRTDCDDLNDLSQIGAITDVEQEFLNRLLEQCTQINPESAVGWLVYAIETNTNISFILSLVDEQDLDFCVRFPSLVEDEKFTDDVPSELGACLTRLQNLFLHRQRQVPPLFDDVALQTLYDYPANQRCRLLDSILSNGFPEDGLRPYEPEPNLIERIVDAEGIQTVTVELANVDEALIAPEINLPRPPDSGDSLDSTPLHIFPEDVLGIFVVRDRNDNSDLYAIGELGEITQSVAWQNTPGNESQPAYSPNGTLGYFYTLNGQTSLIVQFSRENPRALPIPSGYTFDPTSTIAWIPVETASQGFFVTLLDSAGESSIHRYLFTDDFIDYTITPIVPDARNPVVVGEFLIYEDHSNSDSNISIYQRLWETSVNGELVELQPHNQNCVSPAIWNDSQVLFVCDVVDVWLVNLSGFSDDIIYQLDTNTVSPITNLARLPLSDFISFNDDSRLYFVNTDPNVEPELTFLDGIEGSSQMLSWRR